MDAFILGLVYIANLEEAVTGMALDWPPELMQSALDVGVTPSHYITYDRPSKSEQEPYAYFCVAGAFEPDDITRRVGVRPSDIAREGDAIENTNRKRRSSIWKLRSRLRPSGEVDQHVRDVLDQLDASRVAFEELSQELRAIIVIVGFSRDHAPLVLSNKTLLGGWRGMGSD